MNKPPSRASRAKELCATREGQLIRGVQIRWDKDPGGNPFTNTFGNPFLNNRLAAFDNDSFLKAGTTKTK